MMRPVNQDSKYQQKFMLEDCTPLDLYVLFRRIPDDDRLMGWSKSELPVLAISWIKNSQDQMEFV
jgi:hypothetical protein